jgi:hypothetical protein
MVGDWEYESVKYCSEVLIIPQHLATRWIDELAAGGVGFGDENRATQVNEPAQVTVRLIAAGQLCESGTTSGIIEHHEVQQLDGGSSFGQKHTACGPVGGRTAERTAVYNRLDFARVRLLTDVNSLTVGEVSQPVSPIAIQQSRVSKRPTRFVDNRARRQAILIRKLRFQ